MFCKHILLKLIQFWCSESTVQILSSTLIIYFLVVPGTTFWSQDCHQDISGVWGCMHLTPLLHKPLHITHLKAPAACLKVKVWNTEGSAVQEEGMCTHLPARVKLEKGLRCTGGLKRHMLTGNNESGGTLWRFRRWGERQKEGRWKDGVRWERGEGRKDEEEMATGCWC